MMTKYLRRVLVTAVALCPLFLAVMGFYVLAGLREDFPEPAFWDPFAGFFLGFPVLVATGLAAPFGISQTTYVWVGTAIDALFWAFAGVLIYDGVRLLVRTCRKRSGDGVQASHAVGP